MVENWSKKAVEEAESLVEKWAKDGVDGSLSWMGSGRRGMLWIELCGSLEWSKCLVMCKRSGANVW